MKYVEQATFRVVVDRFKADGEKFSRNVELVLQLLLLTWVGMGLKHVEVAHILSQCDATDAARAAVLEAFDAFAE